MCPLRTTDYSSSTVVVLVSSSLLQEATGTGSSTYLYTRYLCVHTRYMNVHTHTMCTCSSSLVVQRTTLFIFLNKLILYMYCDSLSCDKYFIFYFSIVNYCFDIAPPLPFPLRFLVLLRSLPESAFLFGFPLPLLLFSVSLI